MSPPAFPSPYTVEGFPGMSEGLTKRELIAAMAMQGLLANREFEEDAIRAAALSGPAGDPNGTRVRKIVASIAVQWADALLEALKKEGGE